MVYSKIYKIIVVCIPLIFNFCNKNSDNIVNKNSGNTVDIQESNPVTDYDGNTYKTVKIGNQIWMAENLKTVHFSNGDTATSYIYNNDEANLVYGRLYSWKTVVNNAAGTNENPSNIQGIAPDGWHIPSKAEWEDLINNLGGFGIAGEKLNQGLFKALPGGMYAFWKEYQWLGQYGTFATATDESVPGHPAVYGIKLDYNNSTVKIGDFHPDDAVSVRCVKNN